MQIAYLGNGGTNYTQLNFVSTVPGEAPSSFSATFLGISRIIIGTTWTATSFTPTFTAPSGDATSGYVVKIGKSSGATDFLNSTLSLTSGSSSALSPSITSNTSIYISIAATNSLGPGPSIEYRLPEYPDGGTITVSNSRRWHTFTSSGTFSVGTTFTPSAAFEIMAIGGGGGGGSPGGGGGGAGNLIVVTLSATTFTSSGNSISIVIGTGGSGYGYSGSGGGNGGNGDARSTISLSSSSRIVEEVD